MKKHIDYIDIAKGIAILLVVLGHTYCRSNPAGMIVTPVSRFIYSFHMPLFFVVCGITSSAQEEYSKRKLCETIKKNFYSLLVPYLVFSLIYMQFSIENLLRILYASNVTLRQSGARCVQLWYLPCFFMARMFMYGVLHISSKFDLKTKEKDNLHFIHSSTVCLIIMIISFAIGFSLPKLELGYPFNLDVAFVALGFIIFGYLLRNYLTKLDKKSSLLQIILFIIAFIVLCFGNRYGVPRDFIMEMYCSSYGPVFWCIFNGIAGIVMTRAMSSMLSRIDDGNVFSCIKKSLIWLGKNTMGIFLLHQPMNILFIMPWLEETLHIERGNLLSGLIMMTVILSISILLTVIIKRILPEVLGMKR